MTVDRQQRGLVDKVRQIGADHSRCCGSQDVEVDVGGQRNGP